MLSVMLPSARRRASAVLFGVGALLAIAFACLVAAYDLWGGVPRSLWPAASWLVRGAAVCLIAGAIGFIWSHPEGTRLRALVRSLVVLAGLAAVGGAALWFYYSARWRASRLECAPALIAPERATRESALRAGLGPLFPVIDPHSSCLSLLREKLALDTDGTCPTFVMLDVSCQCGEERWSAGDPPACPDGPTACQYRDRATTLGCAEHGSRFILEDAERALRDRSAK